RISALSLHTGESDLSGTQQVSAQGNPGLPTGHDTWGTYYLVINETDMTAEVIPNRTADMHFDVTWVKDICKTCVTAKVKNFDIALRLFEIELHTMNPTKKIGKDVRFIVDLDATGEYYMTDPDDYTKLFDVEGLPNPFRALAKGVTNRSYLPGSYDVSIFTLWISEAHKPIANIPFIIETSYPNRCQEPYMIDTQVIGEFPPGGGGSVTVNCNVYDSQKDHGEVWLRTAGIFTAADILMTMGDTIGTDGRKYTATFSNTLGGGAGLTPILIEAYTDDLGVEPYPLNDYANIFADPGGASAIAGDVFNAVNKVAVNGSVVTIHDTDGGADPLPYTVTDGTYFVPVLPGPYSVQAYQSVYFMQDTKYDVVVPADTTVLVCFGLAPKYLSKPSEAMATISGVIRDSTTGDPIMGAQATLDGGSTTGGVIQARITDSRGHFCFYAVPTYQQSNWTVHAYHPNYIPQDIAGISSAANKSTPQVDFDLVPLTANAIWFENFETGTSNVGTHADWYFQRVTTSYWPGGSKVTTYHSTTEAGDILWRVWDPFTSPIQDIFYVNGECILPPDDTGEGYIPDAWEGHRYLWYGEDSDTTGGGPHGGSFIDEWNGSVNYYGGTSSNGYNAGTAKTGPIDLTGYDELTLTLQTYWEIEAVDPSVQYDAMDVLISTDGTAWDRLDRLNPLAEPIPDYGNAQIAYTSAGYNQAAVWSPVLLDISAYGGNSTVWLRLDFDTRDPLYNGFKGWIVDDMQILPFKL
ncbi:MAG: hypothetical protein ABIC40_01075, partial [bacterium]